MLRAFNGATLHPTKMVLRGCPNSAVEGRATCAAPSQPQVRWSVASYGESLVHEGDARTLIGASWGETEEARIAPGLLTFLRNAVV